MISGDESVTVESVQTEYENADRAIKEYERLVLASPWAAVNQVRCAGYHLLHAMAAEVGSAQALCHLRKARGHCQRAWFDAFEGIIYSYLDFIAKFQTVCRIRRKIETVYPDYREDYDSIVSLQERLQGCPMVQTMTAGDRQEVLEIAARVKTLKVKMLKLWSKVQTLELAKRDEEMLTTIRQFLIPFMATAAGTLAGLLGLLICFWEKVKDLGAAWCTISLLGGALVFYWMIKAFYRWSVDHLLTEDQRLLLKDHEFSLR